jgi:hypothetical protein
MTENTPQQEMGENGNDAKFDNLTWQEQLGVSWKTPMGLFGFGLTTVCFTLLILGLFGHMSGLIENHYAAIITFMIFPAGIIFGLILIPVAFYFRRMKWFRHSLIASSMVIDFGKKVHRRAVILFLVLSVVNITIFSLVAYEAYHFTESDYFCGAVCHTVMAPEYVAYQRSPHAKVGCVECHIGSGADWYVKAKLSGLRQVKAVLDGSYSTPIPAPVEHLRPARDTCEACHWPEKFHGKRIKQFISYTNEDQLDPTIDEIALHIGGRNPFTDKFEGIHWHVSHDVKVEYFSLNDKRTAIGKIKVTRPNGITEEYVNGSTEEDAEEGAHWRTMDCIDCHNRPTHVYDDLEQKIDEGLYSKKLNPEIPGLREDSFTVMEKEYISRDEAKEQIIENLMSLQAERNGTDFVAENEKSIISSGNYLLELYMGNVWPKMKVAWGTYKGHLGHRYEDEGYGCFRCHDEEHETEFGKTISQDCALCHDEPE